MNLFNAIISFRLRVKDVANSGKGQAYDKYSVLTLSVKNILQLVRLQKRSMKWGTLQRKEMKILGGSRCLNILKLKWCIVVKRSIILISYEIYSPYRQTFWLLTADLNMLLSYYLFEIIYILKFYIPVFLNMMGRNFVNITIGFESPLIHNIIDCIYCK